MVELLLESGATPDLMTFSESSRAAIHVAAHRGNIGAMELLLKHGANRALRANIMSTLTSVLGRAVQGSQAEMVQWLLDHGFPIDEPMEEDFAPPLLIAATAMDAVLAQLLVSRGANVNSADFWGSTPLMEAAIVGCLPVLRVLVEEGKADLNKRNNVDATAVDEAVRHDMFEAARYLWLAGGTSSTTRTSGGVASAKWIRPYLERGPSARYSHGMVSVDNVVYMSCGNSLPFSEDKIYRPDTKSDRDEQTSAVDFYRLDFDKFSEIDLNPIYQRSKVQDIVLDGESAGERVLVDEDTNLIGTLASLADDPDAAFQLDAGDASNIKSSVPFHSSEKVSYYEITVLETCIDGCVAIGLSGTLPERALAAAQKERGRGRGKFAKMIEDASRSDYLPGWRDYTFGYHSDDGHTFGCNGFGLEWGARYDKGDIVGCGILWETQEIFFTLNGNFLGIAYHGLELDHYYACIGIRGVSGQFQANFGASPFAFDFQLKRFGWSPLPSPPLVFPHRSPHSLLSYRHYIILISRSTISSAVLLYNTKNGHWISPACASHRFTPSDQTSYMISGNVIYGVDPSGIGAKCVRIWSWTLDLRNEQNINMTIEQILPTAEAMLDIPLEKRPFMDGEPRPTILFAYDYVNHSTVTNGLTLMASRTPSQDFVADAKPSSDSNENPSNGAPRLAQDDDEDDEEDDVPELLPENGEVDSDNGEDDDDNDEDDEANELNDEIDENEEDDEIDEHYFRPAGDGYYTNDTKHLAALSLELDSATTPQHITDYFGVAPVISLGQHRLAFISTTHVGILDLTKRKLEILRTEGQGPASLLFSTCLIKDDLVAVYGGWDQFCQRTDLMYLDLKRLEWYTAHTYGATPRPRGLHCAVPITLTPDALVLSPFVSALDYSSLSLEEAKLKQLHCMVMYGGFSGRAHLKDLEILVSKLFDPSEEGSDGWMSKTDETLTPTNSVCFEIQHPVTGDSDTIYANAIIMASRSSRIRSIVEQHKGDSMVSISVKAFPHLFKSLIKFLWDDDVDFVYHHDEAILFHRLAVEWAPEHEMRICEAVLMERLYQRSQWSKDLLYAFNNPAYSDITLQFDSEAADGSTPSLASTDDSTSSNPALSSEIKAHRCILMRKNEYFRQLFASGLAESNALVLPVKCSTKLGHALIKSIYTESTDLDGLEDDIGELLALADKFRVLRLKSELEQILAFNLSEDNVVSIFELSRTYNAQTVFDACCTYLKQHALLSRPEVAPCLPAYQRWEEERAKKSS